MITTNFDQIKEIIQIPSSLRTKSQLKSLSIYMSNLSFFKIHIAPTGEDIVRKSCEYLQYEFFTCNSFICKIGDPGDKFYVIIQGEVKVLIKPSDSSDLVEAATLGQGSSFGEYALLYNQPRIASILCTMDTHLAVLSKKSYLQILGTIENKRIEEIILFLKNFPVFKNWSKSALARISYFFSEIQLSRKTTVFREGEKIKKVYFLKEGELELLKLMREDIKSNSNKKVHKKNAQVSLLSVGEIVGGEVFKNENYLYTCKVHSLYASMLVISKENFIGRIRNEESQNILKLSHECKEKERFLRMNSLKELKKMYRPLSVEKGRVEQASVKHVCKSIKVVVEKSRVKKRGIDCGISKTISRLELTLKKSGLKSERSSLIHSPLNLRSSLGIFLKKYEHPINIEKKKIFTKLQTLSNNTSIPSIKSSPTLKIAF